MPLIAKRPDHGVAVPIWLAASGGPPAQPVFWLLFYDIPRDNFFIVGDAPEYGGNIIIHALERRGLDPMDYWTSFWFIDPNGI